MGVRQQAAASRPSPSLSTSFLLAVLAVAFTPSSAAFLLLPSSSSPSSLSCTSSLLISRPPSRFQSLFRRRPFSPVFRPLQHSFSGSSSSSPFSLLHLQANKNNIDEAENEEEEQGELRKLLTKDTKEKPLLVYLAFVTLSLLALGIGTYKAGGPLLGLGFSDDRNFYFDSAPSYALLLVYPPLFLFFPEARSLLLKTLVVSFLATCLIFFVPFQSLGWEPTNENVLITAAIPILSYVTFFSWRATRVYLEIAEEDRLEREEREGGEEDVMK